MAVPGCQHFALRVVYAVAASMREGLDPRVHPGNLIVEYQGIGNDGAGHATGLGHVGHPQ